MADLTPIRLRIAAWVLRLYADGHVSCNCDDLDWPDWVPMAERVKLVRDMESDNGADAVGIAASVDRYASGTMAPPAWWLAVYFADEMDNA